MNALSTGTHNIGIGINPGGNINSGAQNIAIGSYALDTNTTADGNTAIGVNALTGSTFGAQNVCIGNGAGSGITTGVTNTAVGKDSMTTLVTGVDNVCIGFEVDTAYTNSEDNIKIGNKFTGNVGNSVVSIGNNSGYIWCAYLTSDTWAQVSDRRLKKNIKDDDLGLAFINELKPVTFNWKSNEEIDPEFLASKRHKGEKKDTETTRHGFIAQDVKAAMDKIGNTTFHGWWEDTGDGQGVGQADFIMPLVKAVQELSAEVEALKSKLEE